MNAFEKIINLSQNEKEEKGLVHTPREIFQQPEIWKKVAGLLKNNRNEIKDFMEHAGLYGKNESTVILTGAGSSEYIGNSICNHLRKMLKREVISIPTTHFVTHAGSTLVKGHKYTLISFARSGDSPESLATYDIIRKLFPDVKHIVITCNKNGALAKKALKNKDLLPIILPDESNDRSLVMTSSFTGMAFAGAGLGYIDSPDEFSRNAGLLVDAAKRIFENYGDVIKEIADIPFKRACYLGSNTLFGSMQECHLKLQEMTEGKVAARYDSFLGLRHGPKVFVNNESVVIAALSSESYPKKYELDLLKELKESTQALATLVICSKKTPEIEKVSTHSIELFPEGSPVDDGLRFMTDTIIGQILGLFKSLYFGLKPDNPSTSGTINRVVKGVVIYDLPGK